MSGRKNGIQWRVKPRFGVRAVIIYCLLTVCAFIFPARQFFTFATPHAGSTVTPANYFEANKQDVLATAHYTSSLPFIWALSEKDFELSEEEDDDDDETNDKFEKSSHQLFDSYSSFELFYANRLKSLLLQNSSSVHRRKAIPFFILHHSWRSFHS